MSTHRAPGARRRTRVGAAMALVVALAALGAIVAVIAGKSVEDKAGIAMAKMTEIELLAPRGTSQLVLTPGVGKDNQWWRTVIAFMPAGVELDNLRPTADLGITHLGYSFSAADPTREMDQQYDRMLYVETDSAKHARYVHRWLSLSKGASAGGFSTIIRGNTVVLSTSVVPLEGALAKSGDGLGSTAAFRKDTAKREAGSLIWEDWGAYVKAAGASGGKPAAYSQFFYGVTGFIKDSRWVGYSTAPQDGWSGRFQAGGMDPKLVSPSKVASAIDSYDVVLSKDDFDNPIALDGGAGDYLRAAFYTIQPSRGGSMGSKNLAFKPKTPGDAMFSSDPSLWLAGTALSGTARPEGISRFAYSINGDQLNLQVAVKKVQLGSTPVRTFTPPPAGSIPLPSSSFDKNDMPPTPDDPLPRKAVKSATR
jgi:hypothetical protein